MTTPAAPTSRDLSHAWIAAATVELDEATARHANFRQSFRVKVHTRIEALEVYCSACRRPFDDVAGEHCSAKVNNEHLIGGDQRERAKRKTPTLPAGVTVIRVPGPRINRRGIDAVIRGEL